MYRDDTAYLTLGQLVLAAMVILMQFRFQAEYVYKTGNPINPLHAIQRFGLRSLSHVPEWRLSHWPRKPLHSAADG